MCSACTSLAHSSGELEALRGFEAAARLLNFTHAAKELPLTQSAISREIRSLEQRLGTKLFERIKGRLCLTHAGQGLQRDVTEALTTMRRGIERFTETAEDRSFVIVTNRSMMSDWLWRRVADYTNQHPEIDLRIAPAPLPQVTLSTRAWYLVTSTRSRNNPHAITFVEWLRGEAWLEEEFARRFLADKSVRGV